MTAPTPVKFIDGHHPECHSLHVSSLGRLACNCTAGRDPELPFPYRSEIFERLWQGQRPVAEQGGYMPYDLVVNCEAHLTKSLLRSEWPTPGLMHVPMHDVEQMFNEGLVWAAARAVHEVWERGGSVLIHCTAGLNRSSLVMAASLVDCGVCSLSEAVELIREQRDPYCFCNPFFEAWARRG